MSISDGLPTITGDAAGVLAVGPDGQGGLLAAVSEVGKKIDKVTTPGYPSDAEGVILRGAHFLYRYDGTSWSQVDASCFSDYQKIYNQEAYNLNPVSYTHLDVYKRQVHRHGVPYKNAQTA